MKIFTTAILCCLIALLTACTPMIYGVPQDRWDLMTEKERIAAMEAYKERQIAYQKAAAERARVRAEQEAIRQAQLEEEMRRRQERVDGIYRGRDGVFGDLLEVTLQDGQIKLSGKRLNYSPVSFVIADGEIKSVPIYFTNGRMEELFVLYEDRHLWIDTDPRGSNTRRAGHLIYNRDWDDGATYTGINSHGSRDIRQVTVDVDVVPLRRGHAVGHRKPTVIVKEKVIVKQAPPKVIVKEKIVHAPPKVIVKEKVVHAPPKVVVKEKVVEVPANKKHKKKKTSKTKVAKSEETPVSGDSGKKVIKEGGQKEEGTPVQKKQPVTIKKAQVVLNGGQVVIDGKHRAFKPIKFTIKDGETKSITLVSKKGNKENLMVSFIGGELFFDGEPGSKTAGRIKAGSRKNVSVDSSGVRSLKKVKVRIDLL